MSLVLLRGKNLLSLVLAVSGALCFRASAGSVTTLEGKSFEGDVRLVDDSVVVTPANASPVRLPLTNLARAVFAPGPFLSSGSVLPNGWTLHDSGDVRGFTRLIDGRFDLRADGQATNTSAFHTAARPMASDGEILARIERVSGGAGTRAGIIMRAAHQSALAMLACDAEGRVWFERRPDADKKEFRSAPITNARLPIWLRLHKRAKTVSAAISHDGRRWETLGRDEIKLLPERVWRENEGESYQLKAAFGVFIASRGKGTTAAARITDVAMTQHGLLGHYFAGREFDQFTFTRLDPQVNFSWSSAPDAALDRRDFSVRWTGQLVPTKSGPVVFYLEGDAMPRLWLDGLAVDTLPFRKPERRKDPLPPATPVVLTAGRPIELKLEFGAGDKPEERPFVKLGWARGDEKPEIVGMTNFFHRFAATNSPEPILASLRTNDVPAVRGVVLRDGTFIACGVTSASESAVHFSIAGRAEVSVLNTRVARILLRPPRQPLPFHITTGRTGVFLRNGDFSESEFRGIEHGGLSMSSVLFGLRKYWIEGGDALAVVLNDCAPASAQYEVRLLDGSVVRATEIAVANETLMAQEPLLGVLAFPVAEVCELRRLGRGTK